MTGPEFREARLSLRLTQTDLAPLVGRSMYMIRGYEAGRYVVPCEVAVKLAELCEGRAVEDDSRPTMTGTELRAIRARLDMTQIALGAAIGTTQYRVSDWELGERIIPADAERCIRALLAGEPFEKMDPVVRRGMPAQLRGQRPMAPAQLRAKRPEPQMAVVASLPEMCPECLCFVTAQVPCGCWGAGV